MNVKDGHLRHQDTLQFFLWNTFENIAVIFFVQLSYSISQKLIFIKNGLPSSHSEYLCESHFAVSHMNRSPNWLTNISTQYSPISGCLESKFVYSFSNSTMTAWHGTVSDQENHISIQLKGFYHRIKGVDVLKRSWWWRSLKIWQLLVLNMWLKFSSTSGVCMWH